MRSVCDPARCPATPARVPAGTIAAGGSDPQRHKTCRVQHEQPPGRGSRQVVPPKALPEPTRLNATCGLEDRAWLPSYERAPGVESTCGACRTWLVSWVDGGPMVTAVVRCSPLVHGPNVAPMWPQRSRPWQARPDRPSMLDATPKAQVKALPERPPLSVGDREGPLLRARGGHGRRGRTALQRGGDGDKLNRRVRPVQGDHLPRWQVLAEGRGSRFRGVRSGELARWTPGQRRGVLARGRETVASGTACRGESGVAPL
jgi:hypothetical protein